MIDSTIENIARIFKLAINMDLTQLSTQEMQIYAAKCLDNYCLHYNIEDDSIDYLIEHLYAMKEFDNLTRWEGIGAKLELSGRGDPLPHQLILKIPKSLITEFQKLVDFTVEVGLIDIYGSDTDKPALYLNKCIDILISNNIDLPIYLRILKKKKGMAY